MREEALNIHEETWHDDVDIVLKFKKHQATYAEVFEYLCRWVYVCVLVFMCVGDCVCVGVCVYVRGCVCVCSGM